MQMRLGDLLKIFIKKNVPRHYYAINELGGGEVDGIGWDNDGWYVYYSERGERRNAQRCPDEGAACKELLRRVSAYPDIELP